MVRGALSNPQLWRTVSSNTLSKCYDCEFAKHEAACEETAASLGQSIEPRWSVAEPLLIVASNVTKRIHEVHIMLGRMQCNAFEIEMGLVPEA